MLCQDVKRVVYFFLDGSLGESKKQDFSSHLNLCPDCEARTKISGRLRNFFRRRLANVAATTRFKQRLERSLRALFNMGDDLPLQVLDAMLLQADGYLERQGQVIHVMAKRLTDRTDLLAGYRFKSRDFH